MFTWKKSGQDDIMTVQPRDSGKREISVMKVDGVTGVVTLLKDLVSPRDLGIVKATVGAEGAVAANAIEIAIRLVDRKGATIKKARQVKVSTLAVTDAQGVVAAAGTPVGTVKKLLNPVSGEKIAWMTTTAGGLCSVRVTDTAVEDCLVEVVAEGCEPLVLKLTFA